MYDYKVLKNKNFMADQLLSCKIISNDFLLSQDIFFIFAKLVYTVQHFEQMLQSEAHSQQPEVWKFKKNSFFFLF